MTFRITPPAAPDDTGAWTSSNALLLHMFSQPVEHWIPMQTDRCDRCTGFLHARWVSSQNQRVARSSTDLARYQQRYQIAVRCPVCQTEQLTQHSMVRNV